MRFAICIVSLVFCLIFCACTPTSGDDFRFSENRFPFDPDLYSWKTASWTPFTVADSITGLTYGTPGDKDCYVAVSRSGVIGWSNNGDIWHKAIKEIPVEDPPVNPADVPDPFNVSFNNVAWGGGIFVAVADGGKTAVSHDGISWTAGEIAGFGSENITGITYGKGMFVAVGGNANISHSTDGLSWTFCKDDAFGGSKLNDIAFDGERERFFIVGDEGKRGWSDDPTSGNWNYRGTEAPFHTNHIRKVTVGQRGNGIGIGIVFDEWGGKRIAIATTHDFGGFDSDLHTDLFGNNTINGIAFGGNCFVAAGAAAIIGWWPSNEPDNNSQRYWRALNFTEFQWWEISAVAALKDRFYVGGVGGKIGYSK